MAQSTHEQRRFVVELMTRLGSIMKSLCYFQAIYGIQLDSPKNNSKQLYHVESANAICNLNKANFNHKRSVRMEEEEGQEKVFI